MSGMIARVRLSEKARLQAIDDLSAIVAAPKERIIECRLSGIPLYIPPTNSTCQPGKTYALSNLKRIGWRYFASVVNEDCNERQVIILDYARRSRGPHRLIKAVRSGAMFEAALQYACKVVERKTTKTTFFPRVALFPEARMSAIWMAARSPHDDFLIDRVGETLSRAEFSMYLGRNIKG